jgi:demethylmenaquinone methyltransferase/2-methoxy-6-polyprenyl-1,4-benzoquinol methylase
MPKEIYNPEFVKNLFNSMSRTYERMNYITSFGFSEKWRRICVKDVQINPGDHVADLMTGMGECWRTILPRIGRTGSLTALDFSHEMLSQAEKRKLKHANFKIDILYEDVFNNTIADSSVDCVVSGFGIKTFPEEQLVNLALEINRILKPGGRFSLIDVSVPDGKILRLLYIFYLKNIIPILGKLFLGNPENYKMLGIYTEEFKNARQCHDIFCKHGLNANFHKHFFGCASGITGKKNAAA